MVISMYQKCITSDISKRLPMFMIEFLTLIANLTLFFNDDVILRVHHTIFAFLRLLEISYLRINLQLESID